MNCANLLRVFYISLLLFFASFIEVHAQKNALSAIEQCKEYIKIGKALREEGKHSQALECLTKADIIAKRKHLAHATFVIKNELGLLYEKMSNYGESLGYYKQVLTIASNNKNLNQNIPIVLNNIALLYHREKDYENAVQYLQRAHNYKGEISDYVKVLTALNISDSYNKLGNYEEARKYLIEVKLLHMPKSFREGWRTNYAETLFIENQIDESLVIVEKLYKEIYKEKFNENISFVTQLLSKIYSRKNNIPLAIKYAKESLVHINVLYQRIELYQQLSDIYYKNGDIHSYKKYIDTISASKDSLAKLINRGLYESNKVKLKVQEYQNESRAYKEKQEADRKLFILCGIFSIVTFFFVYRALKNRIIKQRQEKIITEKQQQIISLELEQKKSQNLLLEQEMREKETNALLEQEQLKNEIDKRNRQLSAKALNLSGRNQIIEDIIIAFGQNPKLKNDPKLLKYINDLKANLKADGWDSFIVHFEEVNNNMLKRLQEKHPTLTPNDLRFIAYLYMNLSYKEIAVIFNITPINCAKRKERIARKMEIPGNLSIYTYISTI
jgi:tetratricopeptide (TPR) repeat protein